MKTFALFLCTVAIAGAVPESPYISSDPMTLFGMGLSLQLSFEMGGMLVRFMRAMKASGNVDVGG